MGKDGGVLKSLEGGMGIALGSTGGIGSGVFEDERFGTRI
jgi:hypothetical protein